MSETVSDFTISRLREWGVGRIYGYPGDGVNGITSALRKAGDVSEVEAAWEEAWASERPVVYEAIVDPDVPPLPPHIGFDQAVAFTRAIYRGVPDSQGIIARSFADLTENFIPHR